MSRLSSDSAAWKRVRARVLQRDAHTCGYCGREATTVDHIVARKNGGTDDEANLIACCRSCNSAKGAKVMVRTAWFNPDWLDRL